MLSFIGVTILVVLGCHIQNIQENRLSTAITFANSIDVSLQNGTHIEPIWFLTGGVKHALENYIDTTVTTEASQMAKMLHSVTNVVLDTRASNTAENFVNLKRWINKFADISNVNVVITTSSFHHKRAQKIFEGVFYDMKVRTHWNLGDVTCPTCQSDEYIHVRNIESDVRKALSS